MAVRVERQSSNAMRLVAWLQGLLKCEISTELPRDEHVREVLQEVLHASLQEQDMHWLQQQMPSGYGPVFAIVMREEWMARMLPSKLRLFEHATSLGGVESLIEWRAMSDDTVSPCLLRVSVGLEAFEDLRADLLAGLLAIVDEKRAGRK